MAPHIADVIDAELQAGSLVIRDGHLVGIDTSAEGAALMFRTSSGQERFTATRVINCTGPSMNYKRVNSPLIQSLFAQGLISSGSLGGGFLTAANGAMVDAAGQVSEWIYNLGPGRLGTLLESIAVPEIRNQAVELASVIMVSLQAERAKEIPGLNVSPAKTSCVRMQAASI